MRDSEPSAAPSEALVAPPLDGVRVVDLSRILAGPYCSMCLGDMGADVIKIERPGAGDDTRRFGPPFVDGVSTYYLAINRNKRSVALDLKSEAGKAVLWRLIEGADVLLENFRPGTLARLGFGYEAVAEKNPRLVYCSISAYGHAGEPEWSSRAGYDLISQGMGGIPGLTGPPDGAPYKVGASIADVVSGMVAYQGILLALLARQRTGVGQKVDTSMFDGQVSLLTYLATAWLNAGVAAPRLGNRHLSIAPYQTYETADGWLNIAVANQSLWHKLCAALDRPELADDARFATNPDRVANIDALDAALTGVLKGRSRDDWIELLTAAGIPCGPVLTLPQTLGHPQLAARGMVASMPHPVLGEIGVTGIPTRLEGTPGSLRRPPPGLGEHTDEVLAELGLAGDAIAGLRAEGIIE